MRVALPCHKTLYTLVVTAQCGQHTDFQQISSHVDVIQCITQFQHATKSLSFSLSSSLSFSFSLTPKQVHTTTILQCCKSQAFSQNNAYTTSALNATGILTRKEMEFAYFFCSLEGRLLFVACSPVGKTRYHSGSDNSLPPLRAPKPISSLPRTNQDYKEKL